MAGRTEGTTPQATDGIDGQAGDGSPGTETGSQFPLVRLAHEYLDARRAQELDHTDEALNWARTEAHDQFMLALDAADISYQDREHAAEIAEAMDELVALAHAYVEASRARWRSMVRKPYNDDKDADHWRLAERAAETWCDWCAALAARCIRTGDRRGLAVAVAGAEAETREE